MKSEIADARSPFEGCKKIYVYCPGNAISGGPELLHQLVAELVKNKVPASIVYYPCDRSWSTPEPYLRYECPVERDVPDDSDVAVIVPEVATKLLHRFIHARRCIWWLSVDNYRGNFENWRMVRLFIKRLISSQVKSPETTIHLCQSYYAIQFIKKRFNISGYFLSDYLADEYLDANFSPDKSDIVVYNPKKGFYTTKSIIKKAKGIKFIPIINMTRDQVRSLLDKAKVYIDFGYHPGKDRIPREAAASGCIVIVGRKGSAANDHDVNIPSKYKFMPWQHEDIISMIRDVFSNYSSHLKAQEFYRQKIYAEKKEFAIQVQKLFGCCSTEHFAIQDGCNE